MWDCMIQEGCIFVKETFNVTLLDTNTSTLVWAGTYLDSIADANTINAAPSGVLVSVLPGAAAKCIRHPCTMTRTTRICHGSASLAE